MIQKLFYVLCFLLLCNCSEGDEGEMQGGRGHAPSSIIGKILVFKKSNGDVYLSTNHLTESNVLVTSNEVDYELYPPYYTYMIVGDSKANYYLEATRKTYVPYWGDYVYATFVFDMDLIFTSVSGVTYQGVQINGNGQESIITGSFTLN